MVDTRGLKPLSGFPSVGSSPTVRTNHLAVNGIFLVIVEGYSFHYHTPTSSTP